VGDGGVDLPPDELELDLGPFVPRRQQAEGHAPGVAAGLLEDR